ncbi:hypothetical protein KY289_003297 [Solanum tuberosum]|nr:hypothetical protein KY289_003297 [Solanum tuberosum]
MESEGALSNRRDANPIAVVEALIHINNQLHQHEAAVGILTYAQQLFSLGLLTSKSGSFNPNKGESFELA